MYTYTTPFAKTGNFNNLKINSQTGEISTWYHKGQEVTTTPLRPNFWRPPTDNDLGNGMHQWAEIWQQAGPSRTLEKFDFHRIDAGRVQVDTLHRLPAANS